MEAVKLAAQRTAEALKRDKKLTPKPRARKEQQDKIVAQFHGSSTVHSAVEPTSGPTVHDAASVEGFGGGSRHPSREPLT